MALSPGTRLGPYEVTNQIGVGGMGEVYRATDTNLKRAVAIKVLPESVAADAERLARFQREAEVLASLNHPHIAAIYGLERSDGTTALVMELVEGPTLADRIAQGPIPVDETLPIAKQIAEALEAAHEQGIIHRDLKPANIKVRPDGTVKVLDFGLAKAMDPVGSAPTVTQSPTITSPAMMTGVGIILGTAAYMSPEHARGKTVGRRSDMWAFGVILFEMLAGHRLFDGDTVSDTIASVLKNEPEWIRLPADTPPPIRRLLRRCLEKDHQRRLDSAADARIEIEDALASPPTESAPAGRPSRRVAVTAAALTGGALIGGLAMWASTRPSPQPAPLLARFSITLPSAMLAGPDRDLALSPDGKLLVYRGAMEPLGAGVGGGPWEVRALAALDARPLAGITRGRAPFFSADGRWLGFFESNELKRVPVAGGVAIPICSFAGLPRGASWAEDGTIVFATNDPTSKTGLLRVSADGGAPIAITTLDAAHGEVGHWFPSILAGRNAVLFTVTSGQPETAQVAVLDLQTNQRKTLVRGSQAEYIAPNYLLFAVDGALRAVRFDLDTLEVLSEPQTVVDQVMVGPSGAANYAVSRGGTLVYAGVSEQPLTRASLVWVDRKGHETAMKAPQRAYRYVTLSPDGAEAALSIGSQGSSDLWIWHFARETLTPLTSAPGLNANPLWTPDGRHIIFASTRAGVPNLYMQPADGTGPAIRLATSATPQMPTSIAPNGTAIIVNDQGNIVWYSFSSAAEEPTRPASLILAKPPDVRPLIATPAGESSGKVSPDGRYVAYVSNASGRFEVFVQPFPQVETGRWQVSTTGGGQPVWARNGRELFYIAEGNVLTVVPVQTAGASFTRGTPVRVFDTPFAFADAPQPYDVSLDGQRFVMLKANTTGDKSAEAPTMTVVLNWLEELKRLVPTK